MSHHVTPPADAPRVALDTLDQTTVRALTDSGYVDHADYLALARVNGWRGAEVVKTPRPFRARMDHLDMSHASTHGLAHQATRPPAQRIGFV